MVCNDDSAKLSSNSLFRYLVNRDAEIISWYRNRVIVWEYSGAATVNAIHSWTVSVRVHARRNYGRHDSDE